MKKIHLLLSLFFMAFLLLIYSCEDNLEQDVIPLERQEIIGEHSFEAASVTEISGVLKRYKVKTGKSLTNSTTAKGKAIYVDTRNVTKVKDSAGMEYYTFGFGSLDEPNTVLNNLVIGMNQNREMMEPYVVRYVMEENARTFVNRDKDSGEFEGDINLHRYTDFF